MITLDVEEYCHECRGFIPKVESSITTDISAVDTVIRCENYKNCRRLMLYLTKYVKKKEENSDG